MFHWWKKRQTLKHAREFVAGTRKLLRIQRDLLDPADVATVGAAVNDLREAVRGRDVNTVESRAERLEKLLAKVVPRPSHAGLRENVEVLLVAVLVAMGVRTFFIQPFKIPTGSMQPTLYGIYPPAPATLPYEDGRPSLPEQLARLAVLGQVNKGDGYRTIGDHIFVDKISYHFRRPQRGEIIVFETDDIPDIPAASRGKFYIKRLVGLPGDRVRVKPPYALIDGKVLDERPAFRRIYTEYGGYCVPDSYPPPKYIRSTHDEYRVPEKHYFVLGDNSGHSLDGRFWGGFPEHALVGRALIVYWPISGRFGLVD
jgi:signal peptidase I